MRRVIMLVSVISSILIIQPSAFSQNLTSATNVQNSVEWSEFIEPAFGFSIYYPVGWSVALAADNVTSRFAGRPDVVQRAIAFSDLNTQWVNLKIWRNQAAQEVVEWFDNFGPTYIEDSNSSHEVVHYKGVEILKIYTPPDISSIRDWHSHYAFFRQGDLILGIEYFAKDVKPDLLQEMVTSVKTTLATQSVNEPSKLTASWPMQLEVASCCNIPDPEPNPFPCNTAGDMTYCKRANGNPPFGNCTWWARYKRTGNAIANLDACRGNANTWDECATSNYPDLVGFTPAAQAVVVWTASGTNHVAYVESVNSNTRGHLHKFLG